ncbi:CBS domain-containing protein [Actinomycetospora flava]|uniref:CBS domain-containing protein n=1 Tax=Actinomycetospora flava TaxID=3129232 RepID=A0ABU8MBU8_9PSEU
MQVAEVMTRFPATVRPGTTLHRAAELIAVSEVGQLMVVDAAGRFVGVLSEGDLVRALLPTAAEARQAGGSVTAAFEAFLARTGDRGEGPVDPLVRTDPITVGPGSHVAEAAVIMVDRGIRRLPVVEDGHLVGTVSRTDVCRAVLAHPVAVEVGDPRGNGRG